MARRSAAHGSSRIEPADTGRFEVVADDGGEFEIVAPDLSPQERAEVNLEDRGARVPEALPLALDSARAAHLFGPARQQHEEGLPCVRRGQAVEVDGADTVPMAQRGEVGHHSLGRIDGDPAGQKGLRQDREADRPARCRRTGGRRHLLERRDHGLVRRRVEADRTRRRAERPGEVQDPRFVG